MSGHSTLAGKPLSAREVQVLRGIAEGTSDQAIARKLGISDKTIKGHLARIKEKIGSASRPHAVTIGYQQGVLGQLATAAHERALLAEAARLVVVEGYVAGVWLARRLGCDPALAEKVLGQLEGLGVVGPHNGRDARAVLAPSAAIGDVLAKIRSGS